MTRALAILAIVVATGVAHAQPAGGDAREQAKARFKQAKAFLETKAYARAAEEYKAAYELDPRPETLFNIAQAYRLAGDKPQAVDYFRRYLAAQSTGATADEARAQVATLQREIDAEAAAAAAQQPPPGPAPAPAPSPQVTVAQPVTKEARRSPALRIAGIATAGAGAIAIGLGVKFGLDARDAERYFDEHETGWGPGDEERFLDGRAANRNMKIAYIAGGALVATGAVLFVIGSTTRAVPVATPESAGVAVTGRF